MTDDSAEWMASIDEELLRLLQDEEIFTPDQLAEAVEPRAPQVAYRCRELTKYGLVTKHAMGMYDISELGERYLAGEVDPSELEPDGDS
jgi:ArsR family transcriptional regulator, cadmium/lead-responsive transcriptional repressor